MPKTTRADLKLMYGTKPADLLPGAAPAAKVERKGSRGPLPKGMEAVLYRIRPDQAAALRRIAADRAAPAMKRGEKGVRPDASALVREAIDAWLAKHDK